MRCTVKKTLQIALASGSDVLVQVKGNQPTLLHDITALAVEAPPQSSHHEDQLGQRNRIETRDTSVWPVAEDRLGAEWSPVRCLIEVRRHTELFNTRQGTWQSRSETAYYVCTRPLSAHQAHQAVRGHWAIENTLHYVRDVTLREDASRIRHQPGVFAQLRTWALNLLRQAGHDNILAARQIIGWSQEKLLYLYCQMQR
jgi:predicted transposase YbfD/YdcC